jgi:beta-galactosidase/beta-glucuronidase
MGAPAHAIVRPAINGAFTFLAGWLDQSWWSDGEYTAPTDDALRFDVQAVKDLGLNTIRLHQKVNSDRWYYYADLLGVVVLQDMPQKYGGSTPATVEPFLAELKAMMDGRGNHPSILQWEIFNEGDCVRSFNASQVVEWAKAYDPHRLIDTNSGGPANDLHIGDVNDVHS